MIFVLFTFVPHRYQVATIGTIVYFINEVAYI